MSLGENVSMFHNLLMFVSSSFEINLKPFCKCRSDCGREALLTLGVFPEV